MKIGIFWIKLGPLTQNFAKQPIIFLVPKVKNLKPDESNILFGTPCRKLFNDSFEYEQDRI